MRAERRNITVSSVRVTEALDRAENVSKYIENAVLYYLDEHEKEYATVEELQETNKKLKEINSNYLKTMELLGQISKVLFKD